MSELHGELVRWLAAVPRRAVACSGGVDSMLLATVAHRADASATLVVHDFTPAVPSVAAARVRAHAQSEGWRLRLVGSGEFDDERYLSNPANRCYFCKTHLYSVMTELVAAVQPGTVLLSGANVDDLGEFRPGLVAAKEHQVRHPFIEIGFGKDEIRALARDLGLDFADIPASPCLASRLYTGTRVTPGRLRAVDVGENLLRSRTGVEVVRCRLVEAQVRVEVLSEDAARVSREDLDVVLAAMQTIEPTLTQISLEPDGYRSGRTFVLHDLNRPELVDGR
ncbi:ATPase [Mycobacterium sp. E796]|uniref:ATP-dependent sacrificial sulfur transferase LarE n=1 Tax=Mycobacterium sp. E796 TaxID=1834151 RepID=UPI0007FD871F|nr:ATPase [Mycobacterium sp. E796]OBI51996.1 ATPase [Mycobacterium sp. E796]